ncbi:MAG: DUF1294 domain-containing protein [Clostridia bacterium]|nr:DUF1294 domain-containing protein [Clostridia bacterium]
MDKNILLFILVYWSMLSLTTVIITVIDKKRAKSNGWRTPEKTLITLAILGAALPEYITMKKIRHKTKHSKFMIGLPIIMLLHLIIICASVYLLYLR